MPLRDGVELLTPPLTYAVGDIHGCYDKLVHLWNTCLAHAGLRACRFVFLGDYVDRGPDTRGVIAFLIDAERQRPGDVTCLKGNHEDMLLLASAGDPRMVSWWVGNGGGATLRSYGVERAADLPADHLRWLSSLRLLDDDGQRLFVHAGVDPALPLDQQREQDLLWMREPFLSYGAPLPRLIVHGHTPVRSGEPDLKPNRVNLDTGAVFGGPLTAAVFEPGRPEPAAFLFAR